MCRNRIGAPFNKLELEENLNITMEAKCGVNITTTDRVTIQYIVEKSEADSSSD